MLTLLDSRLFFKVAPLKYGLFGVLMQFNFQYILMVQDVGLQLIQLHIS